MREEAKKLTQCAQAHVTGGRTGSQALQKFKNLFVSYVVLHCFFFYLFVTDKDTWHAQNSNVGSSLL